MTTESKKRQIRDAGDLDPASLAAIRNLLAEEPEVTPQRVEERQAAKAAAAFAPLPSSDPIQSPRGQRKNQTDHSPRPDRAKPARSAATPNGAVARDGVIARAKKKITGYRPTVKHILLTGLALLIVFRPWLMLGILFLSLFVVTAIFLILGYDGFWRRAMGLARWYARRRPERSVELHRKLDDFAMKWDAVLDRFPEGSVDGLYLPDFGDLAEAEARHDAVLDRRFEGLREKGI